VPMMQHRPFIFYQLAFATNDSMADGAKEHAYYDRAYAACLCGGLPMDVHACACTSKAVKMTALLLSAVQHA